MRRIVLDYIWRWRWIWLLIIITQAVGNIVLMLTKHTQSEPGWAIGPCMGAFLLSFELLRQPLRVLRSLPVSSRELARSFWMIAVGAPGIVLTVTAVACHCLVLLVSPNIELSLVLLAKSIGVQWAFLGASFTLLALVPCAPVQGFWPNLWGVIIGGLWGLCIPGMMFLPAFVQKADSHILYLLIGLGVALCIADIWLVDFLIQRRLRPLTSYKCATPAPCDVGAGVRQARLKRIAYLGAHSFKVIFVLGAWMFIAMLAAWHVFGIGKRSSTGGFSAESYHSMAMSILTAFWCISAMVNMSWMISLRTLRALPLSAGRLAMIILCISAMPGLVFLIMDLIVGMVFMDHGLTLSLKLGCVLAGAGTLIVWPGLRFGLNWKTYLCLVLLMMCFMPFAAQLKHVQLIHSILFMLVTWGIVYVMVVREINASSNPWKPVTHRLPGFLIGSR